MQELQDESRIIFIALQNTPEIPKGTIVEILEGLVKKVQKNSGGISGGILESTRGIFEETRRGILEESRSDILKESQKKLSKEFRGKTYGGMMDGTSGRTQDATPGEILD